MNSGWLREHADQILAVITVILSFGHEAGFFSQEWVVVLSAIVTLAATFIPQQKTLAPMTHDEPLPKAGPKK